MPFQRNEQRDVVLWTPEWWSRVARLGKGARRRRQNAGRAGREGKNNTRICTDLELAAAAGLHGGAWLRLWRKTMGRVFSSPGFIAFLATSVDSQGGSRKMVWSGSVKASLYTLLVINGYLVEVSIFTTLRIPRCFKSSIFYINTQLFHYLRQTNNLIYVILKWL